MGYGLGVRSYGLGLGQGLGFELMLGLGLELGLELGLGLPDTAGSPVGVPLHCIRHRLSYA